MHGGHYAWQGAGYPIEPKSDEMDRQLVGACPGCGLPRGEHTAQT